MKHILSSVAVTAALTLFTPMFVTASASELTCHIPFSFTVNGRTLAPGFYTLSTREAFLLVSGPSQSALAVTKPVDSRAQAGLAVVFLKIGDNYEMIEAWTGNGLGREIPRPQGAKDKRHATNAPAERVVISAM